MGSKSAIGIGNGICFKQVRDKGGGSYIDPLVCDSIVGLWKFDQNTNESPTRNIIKNIIKDKGGDLELLNFGYKLNSGYGKYEEDFTTWRISKPGIVSTINVNSIHITRIESSLTETNAFFENVTATKKFNIKLKISGLTSDMKCTLNNENTVIKEFVNGVNEISVDLVAGWYGFMITSLDGSVIGDCDITIEQIPDYEGALVSDGKDDYGYADNLPIFKDYTVAIDRAWINLVEARDECLSTKNSDPDWGAFNFELSESIDRNTFSFGNTNQVSIDADRKISYQSKYSYNGAAIAAGNIVDGKDLFLFRSRSAFPYYAEAAIWSYLLFPYSLSEFLLERQLKKYKLGTLYPDMIEWRPIAKSNIPYKQINYFIKRSGAYVTLNPGDYFQSTEDIIVRVIPIRDQQLDVLSSIKINGKNEVIHVISGYTQTDPIHIDKSPQKIDITIDEYTRYEDIVQPYPAIINLKQDGKTIIWGDKLKVGSDIVFAGNANLLPELYTVSDTRYNGVTLYPNTIIKVEKSMVFDNARTYLKANEPNCILSPNRLRIPNSSYKILGYIPDLTGKGNHGRLNNFAYTEESGANEDGSIRFDGKDDHITIPTLAHGGKQVLMKVNYKLNNGTTCTIYDQRNSTQWLPTFCIYSNNKAIAYSDGNSGKTYIDGVLNTSIEGRQLANITHNITIANEDVTDVNSVSPKIGTLFVNGSAYAQMVLFDFMLFPDISSEEEIKELNEVMSIEGGYVESPNYYYDAYGKKNTDTDRNLIADQVSK